MGKLLIRVTFATSIPEFSEIVAKLQELSGLPATVLAPEPDDTDEQHELHARLAFTCAPEQEILLFTYRPGASELWGPETVHLEGWALQEPTLPMFTLLALEALGGQPKHPISEEDRRHYAGPITRRELTERRRRTAGQAVRVTQISLLLLPFLMPYYLARGLWWAIRACFPGKTRERLIAAADELERRQKKKE